MSQNKVILPFLPPAFGPASWYGTPDGLIPIYRSVRWHKDEPLEPGEIVPPLDLEEDPQDAPEAVRE